MKIYLLLIILSFFAFTDSSKILAQKVSSSQSEDIDLNNELEVLEKLKNKLNENKEKLNAEELKNLQDIEKGIGYIKSIKSLSKQSLSLDNQVKEAPIKQAQLEKQLNEFQTKKFDSSKLKNLSIDKLEVLFKEHKELGQKLKKSLDEINKTIVSNNQQRDSIQAQILSISERINQIKSTDNKNISEQQLKLYLLEEKKLNFENKFLRQQQSSFLVLNKKRAAQKALLEAQFTNFESLDKEWDRYITQRRNLEVAKKEQEAIKKSREVIYESPHIKVVFERNIELVKNLKKLNSLSNELSIKLEKKKARFEELKKSFAETREMLSRRILNEVVGVALRQKFNKLNTMDFKLENSKKSLIIMAELEKEMLELNKEFKELINIPEITKKTLIKAGSENDSDLKEKLTKAYNSQRNNILQTQDTSQKYFDEIHELDAINEQFKLEVESYKTYIRGHLFWIPSSENISKKNLSRLFSDFKTIFNSYTFKELLKNYKQSWSKSKGFNFLLLLGIILTTVIKYFYIKEITERSSNPKSFSSTLKNFGINCLISLPIPIGFYHLKNAFSDESNSDSVGAIAEGFGSMAIYYFVAVFFINSLRKNSLAQSYFFWNKELCNNYFKTLRLWLYLVIPFIFLGQLSNNIYSESVDNIAKFGLISNTVIVLVILFFLAINNKKYLPKSAENPQGVKLLKLVFYLNLGFMTTILYLAFQGYFYSAFILKNLIVLTGIHACIVFILNCMLKTYLLSKKQKMAELKVRKTLAIKETEKLQIQHEVLIEQQGKILENEMAETRKGFSTLIKIFLIAGLFIIWESFFPAFNILDQYPLWNHIIILDGVDTIVQVTAKNLLFVTLLVFATFYFSSALPNILKVFVLNKFGFDQGQKFTVITILQYLIVTAGLFYSCEKLGVNWSELQWLIAALSVGLGFGLQEIVANFVSGLIVLFERPYRVGDIVTVGQTSGTVSKIQIRATTIRDWDRRELIIPNKSFITGEFINWSLSDSISRVVINVSVALDANIKKVHEILKQLGDSHENTMDDPAPQVFMTNMTADGFDFELRVFVPASKYRLSTKDQLISSIHEQFIKNAITIATPKYQINIEPKALKNSL